MTDLKVNAQGSNVINTDRWRGSRCRWLCFKFSANYWICTV